MPRFVLVPLAEYGAAVDVCSMVPADHPSYFEAQAVAMAAYREVLEQQIGALGDEAGEVRTVKEEAEGRARKVINECSSWLKQNQAASNQNMHFMATRALGLAAQTFAEVALDKNEGLRQLENAVKLVDPANYAADYHRRMVDGLLWEMLSGKIRLLAVQGDGQRAALAARQIALPVKDQPKQAIGRINYVLQPIVNRINREVAEIETQTAEALREQGLERVRKLAETCLSVYDVLLEYQEALGEDPSAKTQAIYGDLLMHSGKPEEAAKIFGELANSNGKYLADWAKCMMASGQGETKKLIKTLSDFRKALVRAYEESVMKAQMEETNPPAEGTKPAQVRTDLLPMIADFYWVHFQLLHRSGEKADELVRQIRAVRERFPMMLGVLDEDGKLEPGSGTPPYNRRFYQFELNLATE